MPGSETVAPTSPPPGDPAFWDAAVGEPLPKRRFPLLGKIGIGVAILLVVAIIAGFVIHVPYSTISPGEAVSLPPLVSVNGAKSFSDSRGDIRLLFVRERNDVSVWRYVQAHFDPDVDIIKDKVLNPQGRSQQQLNGEAQQQMADAKTAATVVALSAAGFKVTPAPGLTVSDLEVGLPAEKVLDFGDVITTVNGEKLTDTQQLQNVIQRSKVGDRVTLGVVRDGKAKTVQIAVGEKDERKLIGVVLTPRFNFPVRVNVNTASIGGPSAGLAMTLAILDDLTPGNLTGAARDALPRIYVPNSESNTVDVIDPATYKVVDHFDVGVLPQHVVPSYDLAHLYVTNDDGNSLTEIDPRTAKPVRTIPVDDPYNMYFTPDGRYAIVVAERLHRLDFRDAHTFELVKSLPTPCAGVDHMDFTADGSKALVSCEFSG